MPHRDEAFEPNIIAFCCNWCSYAGADLAGVSRYQYPPNIKIIRLMCSGRLDPAYVLQCLMGGADGVLVTGCHLGDCHYISGNEKTKRRIEAAHPLLGRIGIDPARLRLHWVSASEGQRFAQVVAEFTEQVRALGPNPLRVAGSPIRQAGRCAHGALMTSLGELMGEEGVKQKRIDWLSPDLKVAESGDTLYFTGCLPYFGFLFRDIGVESPFEQIGQRASAIAAATVALMNAAGISPVVLPDERCCGHDFLWNGDRATFERLAALNSAQLKRRGVKRVVCSCPECARTLALDYPEVQRAGIEVVHSSQLFDSLLREGRLKFHGSGAERTVTYQDPCRLGRHLGVFDAPRELIAAVPGLELVEMADSRAESVCCGGPTGWLNCGATARQIQIARLAEAQATGAEALITACPKCQIHLTCGMLGRLPEGVAAPSLEITDLTLVLASALEPRAAAPAAAPDPLGRVTTP